MLIRDITIFVSSYSSSLDTLPELGEELIFSENVSRFAGGVHGHKVSIAFLSQVTPVDRGALPGRY